MVRKPHIFHQPRKYDPWLGGLYNKVFHTESKPPHSSDFDAHVDALITSLKVITGGNPVEQILDYARWAPSGDNEQPWIFEFISDKQAIIHIRNRFHSINDPDQIATLTSTGALLENIDVAARGCGFTIELAPIATAPEDFRTYKLQITGASNAAEPLFDYIPLRQTSRGLYNPRRLSAAEKTALEAAVGQDHTVHWYEGSARLPFIGAARHTEHLRLITPEIIKEYQQTIDWRSATSEEKMPAKALGISLMSRLSFGFLLQHERLFNAFVRYGGGKLFSYLELGVMPSLLSGALVAISSNKPLEHADDYIAAGRAMQRFWLTVTQLGLLHQPNYTPIAVSHYAKIGEHFSRSMEAGHIAAQLNLSLAKIMGRDTLHRLVWLCRVGAGKPTRSRSIRYQLSQLLIRKP